MRKITLEHGASLEVAYCIGLRGCDLIIRAGDKGVVTIQDADGPATLRTIAAFLDGMADQIEAEDRRRA